MNNINFKRYQNGQEQDIYNFVKKVYDEFVSDDYSDEGDCFFYDWISPSNIASRQKEEITILTAISDGNIVGMIEIRENKNISLLFVDKEFQRQGIAKELFHHAIKDCLQKDKQLKTFHVNASPYSVSIYKKIGFVEKNTMQVQFGIKYVPMEMQIV